MQVFTPNGSIEINSLQELKEYIENTRDNWFNFDTKNSRVKCTINHD